MTPNDALQLAASAVFGALAGSVLTRVFLAWRQYDRHRRWVRRLERELGARRLPVPAPHRPSRWRGGRAA